MEPLEVHLIKSRAGVTEKDRSDLMNELIQIAGRILALIICIILAALYYGAIVWVIMKVICSFGIC